MHFSCQKTDWGAKGAPRGASTKIKPPIWVPFGGNFSCFLVFLMQKSVYLTHVAFFLNFRGALSALGDGLICNPYTYMQSKHTFHFLHFFLKKVPWRVQHRSIWGSVFIKKMLLCKKWRSKNCFKKSAPPDSNRTLFTGREAPGEAASRAHCTDKKQLFEQQLKHCSRFLQKKMDWTQNWCEKRDLLKNVVC